MTTKKSQDIKDVFIYLAMVGLVLLIILPPVFRIAFKEEETPIVSESEDKATALICKKQVPIASLLYQVSITSNYINDDLSKVTIQYTIPQETDPTVVAPTAIDQEIAMFRESPAMTETQNGNIIKFVLTKESLEQNPTDAVASNYFQLYDTQLANLTNLGYTCQEMTA